MALTRARIKSGRKISLIDVFLFLGVFIFVYAMVGVAFEWAGPFRAKTEINLGLLSLAGYGFLSLVRVFFAYFLSLLLTFTYGYVAAKSRVAEKILIPLLDILQSVPVLGFMPGLVLALVHVFPNTNLGLELAAIIMIFTGQGWNMVFSFYSSLKSVPNEFREMAALFRLKNWDVFKRIELPYAMNGLLWNSMLSMAGGWFFVMTIESFSLGKQDFRLPGIGSYMAVAYEKNDYQAVVMGIVVMFTLIILVDRVLWAPLVVWSERFKFDRDLHREPLRSVILDWMKRSDLLRELLSLQESLSKKIEKAQEAPRKHLEWVREKLERWQKFGRILRNVMMVILFATLLYGGKSVYQLLGGNSFEDWVVFFRDTFLTFLRVTLAVFLGSLWTIPVGVFIGTHRKWTSRLQPVVQVVASFPAPMLFPIITFILLKIRISIEFGSVVLMLFASQWYILFNVIAGATQIPSQMLDVAKVFRLKGWHYWTSVILPAIFPSLVNGWITAAGGAWNASIVSEFVLYRQQELSATGIGATITRAAQQGDFSQLAAAIFVMVMTVVLLNRFLWGNLYRLAETRFRLEP